MRVPCRGRRRGESSRCRRSRRRRRRAPSTRAGQASIARPLVIGGVLTVGRARRWPVPPTSPGAAVGRRPTRWPVPVRAVARREARLMPLKLPSFRARRDVYPPDLWTKCPTCSTMLFNKQLDKNLRVCTTCGHHFRLSAEARLEHLLDPGTWSRARRRPAVGRRARIRRPEALPRPAGRRPDRDRACATPRCGAPAPSAGIEVAHRASWTSGSWAARWAPSSARR